MIYYFVRDGWNILPLVTSSDSVISECIQKHRSDSCPTVLHYYSICESHKEMCRRIKNQNLLTFHVRIYVSGHYLIEAERLKIQHFFVLCHILTYITLYSLCGGSDSLNASIV